MTKPELYNFLLNNVFSLTQNHLVFFKKHNIIDIYNEIFSDDDILLTSFEKAKKIYDYCFGIKYCVICGSDSIFCGWVKNGRGGYKKTCCLECQRKLQSKLKLGENNPACKSNRDKNKELWAAANKKNSIATKNNILSGKWTPCVTNSWANSRIKIRIEECDYSFRSTWEALFWILNQDLMYELTRISYIDEKNINRTYITDFTDVDKKIIYEIKPKSMKIEKRNRIKENAAIQWCVQNGYTYQNITEDWLSIHSNELIHNKLVQNEPKLLLSIQRLINENKINS